jgi:peroxiredoxin
MIAKTALLAPVQDQTWSGSSRWARSDELATIIGALERAGLVVEAEIPTVVFAYPGLGVGERHSELSGCTNQLLLLTSATEQLARLGITVYAASTEPASRHDHLTALRDRIAVVTADEAALLPHVNHENERYLRRTTFVLGGARRGLVIDEITDSVAHTRAMVETLRADRLRQWSEIAGQEAPPATTPTEFYPNGADSFGIVAFGGDSPVVAKIGPREVIRAETDFVALVNDSLAGTGQVPLFPRSRGILVEGTQATALMEQVDPRPLDESLFEDDERWTLSPTASADLDGHLTLLDNLYRVSWRREAPGVTTYFYRDRFPAIVAHPGFRAAMTELLPDWDLATFLTTPVLLPDGLQVAGFNPVTSALAPYLRQLVPVGGSLIHGDPHLRNLLYRQDRTACFVDPRTVWDGHQRADAGFGDPAYDLATLLHSVFPMSAILRAVDSGSYLKLLPDVPEAPGAVLDLSGLAMPAVALAGATELENRLLTHLALLPETTDPAISRARLRIGAANALAGWLKYARSLPDPRAWLAVYGYSVWYLDRALSALEDGRAR